MIEVCFIFSGRAVKSNVTACSSFIPEIHCIFVGLGSFYFDAHKLTLIASKNIRDAFTAKEGGRLTVNPLLFIVNASIIVSPKEANMKGV